MTDNNNGNNNNNVDNNNTTDRWQRHLGWSAQQGRILTAEGRAAVYYTADRGFDFHETELPHYYLMMMMMQRQEQQQKAIKEDDADTRTIFRTWRQERDKQELNNNNNNNNKEQTPVAVVVGAWKRTLFYGAWEHTTAHDEAVYNLQTPSLFIDLRLPTTRLRAVDRPQVTSWEDLSAADLRLLARQHVFGGYTVMENVVQELPKTSSSSSTTPTSSSSSSYPLVCTRHHVMDWNFVGRPRNRPNKWYVEPNQDGSKWKEWAFATDEYGQHYYCEHWERLSANQDNHAPTIVALRQAKPPASLVDGSSSSSSTTTTTAVAADGLLLVVGAHFNYLLDERTPRCKAMGLDENNNNLTSLVETVDACLDEQNVEAARAWLSLRGGHGLVNSSVHGGGWTIDAATEFWKEGQRLFTTRDEIQVVVVDNDDDSPKTNDNGGAWWKDQHAHVCWKGVRWEIFECNLGTAQELQDLFWKGL